MIIKGILRFKAFGVGRHKAKYLFLLTKDNPTIELSKKHIKEFFPDLPRGCDHSEHKVEMDIRVVQ